MQNSSIVYHLAHLVTHVLLVECQDLSFIRLVGTVYFKKHLASFKYSSPRALFNSVMSEDPISQHKQWLDYITCTVWACIEFEDQLPPSWEAL